MRMHEITLLLQTGVRVLRECAHACNATVKYNNTSSVILLYSSIASVCAKVCLLPSA